MNTFKKYLQKNDQTFYGFSKKHDITYPACQRAYLGRQMSHEVALKIVLASNCEVDILTLLFPVPAKKKKETYKQYERRVKEHKEYFQKIASSVSVYT